MSYQIVVQGQGITFAEPQMWEYGAYSGTGQRTRAPVWHAQGERPEVAGGPGEKGLECQAWSAGRRGFSALACRGACAMQTSFSSPRVDGRCRGWIQEDQLGPQGPGVV